MTLKVLHIWTIICSFWEWKWQVLIFRPLEATRISWNVKGRILQSLCICVWTDCWISLSAFHWDLKAANTGEAAQGQMWKPKPDVPNCHRFITDIRRLFTNYSFWSFLAFSFSFERWLSCCMQSKGSEWRQLESHSESPIIHMSTKLCQPTPVFLPGESHGQRSLAGYSPWGHKSRTLLSD